MRARTRILTLKSACIASTLAVGACDWAAAELVPLPDRLTLPVFTAEVSDDTAANLQVAVSATDRAGRSPGQPGFAGASRNGECRVYIDNVTPVSSDELYDRAFLHLDRVVRRSGGVEALLAEPDNIPVAHIWGDVNAPWRCIAGTIYNVQAAGYPTVGFISTPDEDDSFAFSAIATHAVYIDMPVAIALDARPQVDPVTNMIMVTARNEILWNGAPVNQNTLRANLRNSQTSALEPELHLKPESEASYDLTVKVLSIIVKSNVARFGFVGNERHRSFGKDESGVDPTARGS